MSNLYKQKYFICETDNTRIIDTNQLIAEKLDKLKETEAFSEEEYSEGFVAGIDAQRVELLLADTEELKQQQAEEVLLQANAEAEQIRADAVKEAGQIRERAYEEGSQKGYEEGRKLAMQELNEGRQALEAERKRFLNDYERQVRETEPMLVDTILHVFEKVFHIQFDDKRSLLLHLVEHAVSNMENSKEFYIKVPRENYHFIMENRLRIEEQLNSAAQIEIIEDPLLKKNQCKIETDSGVFDCSLDIQMSNLIRDLKSLSI